MLQLINSLSQTADLYSDTIIPIERNNPLFNEEDELFADITYGFKLPLTAGNQEFIKNAHLVETDNSKYRQEITLLVDGTPLHAGIMEYKITGNDIDAVLKINFGAISDKVKTIKMAQIYTGDALPAAYGATLMKDACVSPKDYPYSFFPVYNEAWSGQDNETRFVINNWDHAAQNFNLTESKATCPYFKLKYLLQKVVEVLGFQLDGNYLRDPESEEIFVYTRMLSSPYLNGSFTYLPGDLTIADFLKRIKERFNISCNFDLITGKVIVVTPNSALQTSDIQDIGDYVTSVDEISVPERNGYSIVLKPDEEDELFLDTTSEKENTYSPTNQLNIGNKEKVIEMESSTLKVKAFDTYSMPATKQELYFSSNKNESFPLRFLRYRGMKDVGGGKVFPEAYPMELSLDDATWYKFRNESKSVKLKITIPAFTLARLKVHQRITFKSKEGTDTIALPQKISYNLNSGNSGYISATVECRTMVSAYSGDVQLIDYVPELDSEDSEKSGLIPTTYKAYYDARRLPYVDIEIRTASSRVNGRSSTRREQITSSTDRFGMGGKVIAPPLVTPYVWELRVTTGIPKYAIVGGVRFYFEAGAGYYFLNLNTLSRSPYDVQGVWIIFENLDGSVDPVILPPGGGGTDTPPDNPPVDPPVDEPEEPEEPPIEEPEQPPVEEPEPFEPPAEITALKDKFDFPVGATLKSGFGTRSSAYKYAYRKHYNRIGAENHFKMHIVNPREGEYNFAGIDAIFNEAETYDFMVHVHCITWADVNAAWLKAKEGIWTEQQFRDYLISHITRVLNHCLPWIHRIAGIDAINEAFGPTGLKSSFWKRVLPDFIDVTINTIRSIMPNVPLFINDYDFEDSDAKGPTVINFIQAAASRGVIIDGIGSQSHSSVALDMAAYEKRLRVLGNSGLLIHVSELDVILKPGSASSPAWATSETWLRDDQGNPVPELDAQGNPTFDSKGNPIYKFKNRSVIEQELFRSSPARLAGHSKFFTENFRLYPKCIPPPQRYGMTTWCVGIADSGINYPNFKEFPGLFFIDYTPTPAIQALIEMPVQEYVAA